MSTNGDTRAKVLEAVFFLAMTKQKVDGKTISQLAGIGYSTANARIADLRIEMQKKFGSSKITGAASARRGRNADSAAGANDNTPAEPPKKRLRVKKNAAPKTNAEKKEFKTEDDEGQPVGNAPQHGDGEDFNLFDE